MKINFGKYSGQSIERLMLKQPQYINWILRQNNVGAMFDIQNHIYKLIEIFDKKTIAGPLCSGNSCNKPASRFTVCLDIINPYWWCNTCNPHKIEFFTGNLFLPLDYISALQHVTKRCKNRTSDHKVLIKILSQAKGLSKRVGEAQAMEFFEQSHPAAKVAA